MESDIFFVDWKIVDKFFVYFVEVFSKGSNVEVLMGRVFYYEFKENYIEVFVDFS